MYGAPHQTLNNKHCFVFMSFVYTEKKKTDIHGMSFQILRGQRRQGKEGREYDCKDLVSLLFFKVLNFFDPFAPFYCVLGIQVCTTRPSYD